MTLKLEDVRFRKSRQSAHPDHVFCALIDDLDRHVVERNMMISSVAENEELITNLRKCIAIQDERIARSLEVLEKLGYEPPDDINGTTAVTDDEAMRGGAHISAAA